MRPLCASVARRSPARAISTDSRCGYYSTPQIPTVSAEEHAYNLACTWQPNYRDGTARLLSAPAPASVIAQTNERVHVAIVAVRSFGRSPETMCELRDALAARSRSRAVHLTPAEEAALQRAYLAEQAPDILQIVG